VEVDNLGLADISIERISVTYDGFRIASALKVPSRLRFLALENVSLNVEEGETVAVMGNNGAGKSTLLRFIAGKLRPSSGHAEISGRIIHLYGVNPGFDTVLSPRQNIQWLSSVYGAEPDRTNEDVEKFSDIGAAYDRPVKTLSGGMRGRVGFGFATSLNPDILLIDEVLGVGDPSFKAKAMDRLKEMMRRSGIVVLSTHSVGLVKELATRCIILQGGSILHDGDVQIGIKLYSEGK
jgi:ABC-type polysaccharide/polyol phosphate transport system ATPase subunit